MSEEFFLSGRPWPGSEPGGAPAIDFDAPDPATADTERPPPPAPLHAEPRHRLPQDSAERKRVPLCTGVLDYFPATIEELMGGDVSAKDHDATDDVNAVLYGLMHREDPDARILMCLGALRILQGEIKCGEPLECILDGEELIDCFAEALAEVAKVSYYGNEKHNRGQPLHHARWKSTDHPDTIARHLVERGGFDGPMRHSACLVWRCFALDQIMREAEGAPVARGARLAP